MPKRFSRPSPPALAQKKRIVILSLEESPDLDSTALDVSPNAMPGSPAPDQVLLLARIKDHIRDALRRVGATELADQRSYHSVADAFEAAQAESK